MIRIRSKLLATLATVALFGGLLAVSDAVDPRLERTVALLQIGEGDARAAAKDDYDKDEDDPIGTRLLAVLPPPPGIEEDEDEEKDDDRQGGSK